MALERAETGKFRLPKNNKRLYRALDVSLGDGKEHSLTAPLVSSVKFNAGEYTGIAKLLPDDWPGWGSPDYSEIKKEIENDPRWQAWVERTQS